jgi:hypothetical protein
MTSIVIVAGEVLIAILYRVEYVLILCVLCALQIIISAAAATIYSYCNSWIIKKVNEPNA